MRRVGAFVGTTVDVGDLEASVAEYEQEIDEYVERDEDLQSYVERLERMTEDDDEDDAPAVDQPEEHGSVDRLVAEVEQFLRDQGQ